MAQVQRPLRGSRISTFYPVKSLPSLSSLDSAFQLQEYISLLIRLDVHDVDAIVSVPGRSKQKEKEKEGDASDDSKKAEVTVDEACWKYEQLRRLAQDLSHPLITMLQQVCTRTTCPEMKAGEWLYLCVAHGNDGAMEQCCAIDYILHTLDSATALLNSPRAFPSRLQIPATSHRHFTSLARRLGRIFAHAYFHHREEFAQAEAESALYARFLALTEKFDLVPADFLVIPRTPAPTEERVRPPTLGGAALHVDIAAPREVTEVGSVAERAQSASPPGLDEALSPQSRRMGRNRTDTMMLEGDKEGRFPSSPASALEEGPNGLDAAIAAAAVAKDVPAVAASPVVVRPAPEVETMAKTEEQGEMRESGLETEGEREREPPSPTSDEDSEEEELIEPPEGALPMVSPSSSTALQTDIPMRFEFETEAEGVPAIAVEPATPPAVAEENAEDAPAPVPAPELEAEKKEEVVAPVAADVEEPKDAAAVPEPAPAAAETPVPVLGPSVADEEVDVTDLQKDAEESVEQVPTAVDGEGEKSVEAGGSKPVEGDAGMQVQDEAGADKAVLP
ncbi:Mob1/phocein [Mycena belliarum]|uniref:Mob1/phocein n=1 Tax=Mycena belliarum TaxID=1033014 RepID=A0AAD6UF93_9AGAR|nr:Mob1/phocein [Mycena belliae]